MMGKMIISPTYRLSSPRSCCGIASSSSSFNSSGLARPRTLVMTIVTRTTLTRPR